MIDELHSINPSRIKDLHRPAWRRLMTRHRVGESALVLLCQLVLLTGFLATWEWATASDKQSAFLFG